MHAAYLLTRGRNVKIDGINLKIIFNLYGLTSNFSHRLPATLLCVCICIFICMNNIYVSILSFFTMTRSSLMMPQILEVTLDRL